MAKFCLGLALKAKKNFNYIIIVTLVNVIGISYVSHAGNGDLKVGGTLEMSSTSNGFLPPRMSTSSRDSLNPSSGMLIYNVDDNVYNYYTSSGWKTIAATLPIHDNTATPSDYELSVGETAKITYNLVTSVPLHIATVQGEYELTIQGDRTVQNVTSGNVWLKPNNLSYTGKFLNIGFYFNGSTSGRWSETDNYFNIGANRVAHLTARVSTTTTSKTVNSQDHAQDLSGPLGQAALRDTIWDDTSTAWTSLGTVVFPFAQSGTILIKRII
jgi:hypothetical protein